MVGISRNIERFLQSSVAVRFLANAGRAGRAGQMPFTAPEAQRASLHVSSRPNSGRISLHSFAGAIPMWRLSGYTRPTVECALDYPLSPFSQFSWQSQLTLESALRGLPLGVHRDVDMRTRDLIASCSKWGRRRLCLSSLIEGVVPAE